MWNHKCSFDLNNLISLRMCNVQLCAASYRSSLHIGNYWKWNVLDQYKQQKEPSLKPIINFCFITHKIRFYSEACISLTLSQLLLCQEIAIHQIKQHKSFWFRASGWNHRLLSVWWFSSSLRTLWWSEPHRGRRKHYSKWAHLSGLNLRAFCCCCSSNLLFRRGLYVASS